MLRSLCCAVSLASLTNMLPAQAGVLTLPDALAQALARNPKQISQRLEVERSGAQQRLAHGARWPTIDFNASATYYGHPTFVHGIRTPGVFPPLDKSIYDLGLALSLPLYTGGKLSQGIVIADLGRQIALERERLGVQDLSYNVTSAYLKVEQLDALAQAYGARIESLLAQQQRVELFRATGRAAKLDQLKIKGLLTQARHDELQVRNRRRETLSLLYQLMGTERPVREVPHERYVALPVQPSSLDDLQQQAVATRPDLRIADRQRETAVAGVERARAEQGPQVALASAYRERSGSAWRSFDDWSVGVLLTTPVFDGGVRQARVDDARLAQRQTEQLVEQARLAANKQVEDAWNARGEAQSRLEVTATSVAEASEALAIEKLRVAQGVGAVTDMLSAETALLRAQADRLQAQFDLIIAGVDLLRATGMLEPERIAELVVERTDSEQEKVP